MKTHRKFIRLINLKLDGRLDAAGERRLEDHLKSCAGCRQEWETMAHLRSSLASSPTIKIDKIVAERRTQRIMAAIRENCIHGVRTVRRVALKPVLGIASILVVFFGLLAVVKHQEPQGPVLFANPEEVEFDAALVKIVNEYELTGGFEAFSNPAVIYKEREVNSSLLKENID